MKRSKLLFWIFLAPCLSAFAFTVLVPFVAGIYYSFTDWKGIDGTGLSFIGLNNYKNILKDYRFFNSFIFTIKFTIVNIVVLNVLGFGLALLATRESKLKKILRTSFFAPNLIGGLILGFIWQFIFIEVFKQLSKATGFKFLDGWLSDASTGFWGMTILMAWQFSGYIMVIYIASIEAIPGELIESIELDGANGIQKILHIVFPLTAPAFTVSLFLTLSNSFKLYDQNFSLTSGGPARETEMLAMNILQSYSSNRIGEAQAKGIIFFIVVAVISLIQVNISKKREIEA